MIKKLKKKSQRNADLPNKIEKKQLVTCKGINLIVKLINNN